MKDYQANKIYLGDEEYYVSTEDDVIPMQQHQAYLMAFAEAVEAIKTECSAEGLQIHPSCVEFVEGKSPLISEDFTEYDDTYMDYFDGYRRHIPSWSPRQYVLLKDNKGNHYGVNLYSWLYDDVQMMLDDCFVDSDDEGQPDEKGQDFINEIQEIINEDDYEKDFISIIRMNCWKCRDDIHEYLARHSYVEGDIVKVLEEEPAILNEWKSRCEYKPIEWIDLNSLNIA